MITTIAIIPATPLLLPDNVGRVDPIPELRAAVAEVVETLCAATDSVIVLASADRDPRHSKPPVALRIAHLLLAPEQIAYEVVIADDTSVPECHELALYLAGHAEGSVGLLVVADGSACRTEKAPGYLDERAEAFDGQIEAAVASGNLGALQRLDPQLADELLAQGRSALQTVGFLGAGGDWRVERCETSDPFGVFYLTALLRRT